MLKIQTICTLETGYTSVTCYSDNIKMEIKLDKTDGLHILALVAELAEKKLAAARADMNGISTPLLGHIPDAEVI